MRFSTAKLMMLMGLGTLILLFPADGLRALGLGEARVDSYLGQPLDITIRLIEADADALDSLTADQASASDYERLGVPSQALGLGLEVQVDRRSDPPLLRVTSRRPASDPVLRFMIDARWSSGRVLREYTVFLDPPTYAVAPPVSRRDPEEPPAERPAVAEPEPAPRPRPTPDRPARPAEPSPEPQPEPEPAPRAAPGLDVIGPVAAGQTLWGIAYEWRPDTSLTMNQVMLAILDRNPQAFRDNNVNRLQQGAELNMPQIDEIQALSANEADRRMQAQMQAWRDRATEPREVPVVAEDAVPEVERTREVPTEETPAPEVVHRLEVVPPESEVFDEGTVVSDGEMQRASSRLSELEDRMYADGLENDELFRHVESIREAIETRDAAGLAVADEELAILESRLRQARLARLDIGQRVIEPDADEDAVSDYFRELEDEMASDAAADDAVTGTRPDPAEELMPEPEPAETPVVSAPEQAGRPWWLWLVVAMIVIALATAVMWVLKRRAAADMQRSPASGRRRADAVEAARKRLDADPRSLAAHLALLRALAEQDDNERFAEALDDMYRQVESDDDPAWQEALNLAVVHAPEHPLLTPTEQRFEDDGDDDEGLDDRTREMLGILKSEEDSSPAPDDYELGSEAEPDADLGGEEFFATDEDEPEADIADTRVRSDGDGVEAGDDEEMSEDMDLAKLSDRLDDPTLLTRESVPDSSTDEGELDIGEFDVDDERDSAEDIFREDLAEDKTEDQEDKDSELDLDFEFETRPDADPDELAAEDPESPEADEIEPKDDDQGERDFKAFLSGDGEDEDEDEHDSPVSREEERDADDSELSDEDAEVKLDLARAYLSMDDPESARALLEEITSGGSAAMREQAAKLLDDL